MKRNTTLLLILLALAIGYAVIQTVRLNDVKDRAEAWAQAFSSCRLERSP